MPVDLTVLLPVLGLAGLYLRGLRRLPDEMQPTRIARLGATVGAVALLVALSAWMETTASQSLATHMVQHQLLVLVAAPLLAAGGVVRTVLAAVVTRLPNVEPPPGIAIWAVAAAILHLVTMSLWHLPSLYELALQRPEIHHLEHLTMLGTAFLAWTAILAAASTDAGTLGAIAGLAPLAIGGAAVGVLLLAAPDPLYPTYLATQVDPLTDQRIGGALMKVGALLVYVGAAAGIGATWLQRLDARDAQRRQPQRTT